MAVAGSEYAEVVTALRQELERQMVARQPRINYDNCVRAVLVKLQSQGWLTPLDQQRTGAMIPTEVKVGEVVRITDVGPVGWSGVLVQVDKVTSFGITAVAYLPNKDSRAPVNLRLEWGQFVRLGDTK